MTTILSYVERGKQPIRELTVSVTKYRSCVEKERYKGILSTISTFMVLGHATVNITMNRYVHPTYELKKKNMQKLSGLLAVK